jgi:hypothetical protein
MGALEAPIGQPEWLATLTTSVGLRASAIAATEHPWAFQPSSRRPLLRNALEAVQGAAAQSYGHTA